VCLLCVSKWVVFVSFKRHVRRYLVDKPALPLYIWKRNHFLFLLVWRMTCSLLSIIVFFLSSSSPTRKGTWLSSLFLIFVFIFLISCFHSYPFYKIHVCFQFSHSITIRHVLYFSFQSFFISIFFCQSFIDFQFHHSIKVYVFFFLMWPSFFWYVFPFIIIFLFQFNSPIEHFLLPSDLFFILFFTPFF